MAFVFRFRVLMQHRQYLHKKAQTNLAAARNRLEETKIRREIVGNQIVEQRQFWEQRQSGGMHVSDFLAFRDYLIALEQQLLALDGELDVAVREVEKAKSILIEREKELKALESLEEKERTDYRYEQTRKEQRQADEVAIFKDLHKKNGQ